MNQLFAISDEHYETSVMRVIDRLRLRFNYKLDTCCRFIFNRNRLLKDSLAMNVLCFLTLEQAVYFNASYEEMYNKFILSPDAIKLTYYDDRRGDFNKHKVIYLQENS